MGRMAGWAEEESMNPSSDKLKAPRTCFKIVAADVRSRVFVREMAEISASLRRRLRVRAILKHALCLLGIVAALSGETRAAVSPPSFNPARNAESLDTRTNGPTPRTGAAVQPGFGGAKSTLPRDASITVFPEEITLLANQDSHHLLITHTGTNGLEENLTARAKFASSHPSIARVTPDGIIWALKPGAAVVKVRVGNQTAAVRVTVQPAPIEKSLSFINDV